VVDHGVTGFVAEDDEALVEAVHAVDRLDRAACRAAFERRFTDATMAARYAAVYALMLAQRPRVGRAGAAAGVRRELSIERPLVHR
jgi:hypothetical protein